MSTITGERQAVISHAIGEHGTLVLRTVRGSVRVRGTDGSEVRVEARYAVPRDAAAADPEHDGVLRVTRSPNELSIEADDTDGSLRNALGTLFGGGRPRIDFDVTLPRTAALRLSGVSANLEIRGLRGDQDIRTVSGDVSLVDGGGRLTLQSVSGDASIQAGQLDLRATTTSGDLDARAGQWLATRIRTVSGDVRLAGALQAGYEHSIESISGDLEIAPDYGVTATLTSISGSIHTELPQRRDSGPSRRSVVIGDGAAAVSFRTMSGDLSIARGSSGVAAPAAAAPSAGQARPQPPRTSLDVLRALERGEIDVEAAGRLLEALGNA